MSSRAVHRRPSQLSSQVFAPSHVVSSQPLAPVAGQQRRASTTIATLRDPHPPSNSTLPTPSRNAKTPLPADALSMTSRTLPSNRITRHADDHSNALVSLPVPATRKHDILSSTLVAEPGKATRDNTYAHPLSNSSSNKPDRRSLRGGIDRGARLALGAGVGRNSKATLASTTSDPATQTAKKDGSILAMAHSSHNATMSKKERSLRTTGGLDTVVVVRSEKDSLAFALCVKALQEGCIDSYIHLFELANRPPVCVDELSQRYFTIREEKLQWVQEQLCAVEVLRRQSEFREVYTRCVRVADYFESEQDIAEAGWYYERALQYVHDSLDRVLEQEVHAAYAAFYERHHQMSLAEGMYMRMYRLATALQDQEKIRAAAVCLVRVYRALGDQTVADAHSTSTPSNNTSDARTSNLCVHSSGGNRDAVEDGGLIGVHASANRSAVHDLTSHAKQTALAYYEKSVLYAQRSGSALEESAAYEALGNYLIHTADLSRALQCHRRFRVLAKREGQTAHACRAALTVANLETRLQLHDEAAESLKEALRLAKQLGDSARVCRATMQMGDMCRSSGDNAAAAACFKESFAAACASERQELIDSARVAMGFARGADLFVHAAQDKGYCYMVCHDLRAQLQWLGSGTIEARTYMQEHIPDV